MFRTLPLLFALLATLFSAPIIRADEKAQEPRTRKDVKVEAFEKLIKKPNTVVLDVRTPKEYADGHIPGAVNIDVRSPEFKKKVADLDKSKTYLVHCATGRRSVTACTILDDMDFDKLVNLEGGMAAWKEANKPVEKGEPKPQN